MKTYIIVVTVVALFLNQMNGASAQGPVGGLVGTLSSLVGSVLDVVGIGGHGGGVLGAVLGGPNQPGILGGLLGGGGNRGVEDKEEGSTDGKVVYTGNELLNETAPFDQEALKTYVKKVADSRKEASATEASAGGASAKVSV